MFALLAGMLVWVWNTTGDSVDWALSIAAGAIQDAASWVWSLLPQATLNEWWNGSVDGVDRLTWLSTFCAEIWAVMGWFIPMREMLAYVVLLYGIIYSIRFVRLLLSIKILGFGIGT